MRRDSGARVSTLAAKVACVGGAGALAAALGMPPASAVAPSASAHHADAPAMRVSPFGHPRGGAAARSTRATPSVVLAARGGTLYVSPGGSNASGGTPSTCRLSSDPCQTIAYAISVAQSGDTIDLAAGKYAEQVVVPGGMALSFVGAGEASTSIDPKSLPVTDTDPDDTSYTNAGVVVAQAGSTVDLKGLTVDASGASPGISAMGSCANDLLGVYYRDADGTLSSVSVVNAQLTRNLLGCQVGQDVYVVSDAGSTSDVTMSSDSVSAYQKNGITCDDPGTTCSVAKTTVDGIGPTGAIAQNGIQGYGAASLTVTGGRVLGNTYTGGTYSATGILLIDNGAASVTGDVADTDDAGIYAYADADDPADATLTISGDTASQSTGSDADGIVLQDTTTGTVSGDKAYSDTQYGIALFGASGATVNGNQAGKAKANSDGVGIYVGDDGGSPATDSTADTVSGNTTNYDGTDGILVEADSSGDTFASNTARADTSYDYQDLSTGPGTAGTANTWTSDTCTPAADASPEGLCS